MELQEVCDSLVRETDGVLACVVLDLGTGLVLAQSRRRDVEPGILRRATRAADGIFRGKLLRQFVRTLPTRTPFERFVNEAQLTTSRAHSFLSTLPGVPDAVLVCITERTMSIGLGWMALHQAIDRVDPASATALARSRQPTASDAEAPGPHPQDVAVPHPARAERGPTVAEHGAGGQPPPPRPAPEPIVAPRPAPPAPLPRRGVSRPESDRADAFGTGETGETEKSAEPPPREPPEDRTGREAARPDVGKISARAFFSPKPNKNHR